MVRCLLLILLMAAVGEAASFGIPRAPPAFGVRKVTAEQCLYIHDPPLSPGTAAAVHIGNTKSCIALPSGYRSCIPSWVAFFNHRHPPVDVDVPLVGEAARDHASIPSWTAISGFTRLLNRRLEDPVVKKVMEEELPYNFTRQLGWASIQLLGQQAGGQVLSPHYLAGILISELKQMAEAHLGREIEDAVITVPRHLTYDGRQSLRFAGRHLAGFRAVRIVDQQIAAAAAHGHHTEQGDGKVVLVLHVGGRTSHATVFKMVDGVPWFINARDDLFLGGKETSADFTARVVDHFVELLRQKHGFDIRHDKAALLRLRTACEQAKKALSQHGETIVQLDSLIDGVDGLLTRAKLEELNSDLFHAAMALVDWVVMQAPVVEEQHKGTWLHHLFDAAKEMAADRVLMGLNRRAPESLKDMIDEIVLVGGSARIPKIRQLVKDYFHGKEPSNRGGVEPDEAITHGALLLTRPEAAGYLEECHWGPRLPRSPSSS